MAWCESSWRRPGPVSSEEECDRRPFPVEAAVHEPSGSGVATSASASTSTASAHCTATTKAAEAGCAHGNVPAPVLPRCGHCNLVDPETQCDLCGSWIHMNCLTNHFQHCQVSSKEMVLAALAHASASGEQNGEGVICLEVHTAMKDDTYESEWSELHDTFGVGQGRTLQTLRCEYCHLREPVPNMVCHECVARLHDFCCDGHDEVCDPEALMTFNRARELAGGDDEHLWQCSEHGLEERRWTQQPSDGGVYSKSSSGATESAETDPASPEFVAESASRDPAILEEQQKASDEAALARQELEGQE